jgi:hypothetical protein
MRMNKMGKSLVFVCVLLAAFVSAEEVQREYCGTVYKTTVNDNRVNVRSLPSTSAKVVGQKNKGDVVYITGFSSDKETLDGHEGYWVRVSLMNDLSWDDKNGWIFSKYANLDAGVSVSEMTVAMVNPATARNALSLKLNIKRYNASKEVTVAPQRLNDQAFYTFTWSDDESDFLYCDPVGTFIWNPETNEIKHISYMGYGMESAWCLVTNDLKYLLQDFGTGPAPRGLGVFDMETSASLYSGSYYGNLEYDGRSVVVIEELNLWDTEHRDIDAQSLKYATEFKNKASMTEDQIKWKNEGGGIAVIVRYRLDLSTMKREFIGCRYIQTQ